MRTVTISEAPLAVEDLLAVVDGARVELDQPVRARIAAGRTLVDRALTADDEVYGLTTQVGHGKDTRLTEEEVRGEQLFLVTSHSGGIGRPLPVRVVRAAMTVRLNGIARGWSGADVAVADVLVAMLNAGVHPVVPETASVGAGDLGQMAGIAQVAVGLGRAEYRGEVLPGGEALRRAAIAPVVLGGRDGLPLISANGVSVGHAALVVVRAESVAAAADVAAGLSMEATRANPSILHPAIGRAKPIPGQVAAADHLLEVLAGSELLKPGAARSVQDALSFRVVPQVHGALREYIAATRQAVLTEQNAGGDNPLVSVSDQALISNGNFHPMVLAIACDAADRAGARGAAERASDGASVGRVLPQRVQRWSTAGRCVWSATALPGRGAVPRTEAARRPCHARYATAGFRRRRSRDGRTAQRTQDRCGAGHAGRSVGDRDGAGT